MEWGHWSPEKNWLNSPSEQDSVIIAFITSLSLTHFHADRFFGDTPPILQQFLERLGYEVLHM